MSVKTLPLSGALALAFAAASAPVAAEVIEKSETHFVTRDARVIAAEPYEVWAALIAPGGWWNDSHTWSGEAANLYLSAQAGGCFCELLPERSDAPEGVRRGSARHMEVVQAAPPAVLRMRGGLGPLQSEPVDGVLTITLKPVDGGTRVLWEYVVGGTMRFEIDEISGAVDGVMSQQLAGLAELLGEVEGADAAAAGDEEADEVEGTELSRPGGGADDDEPDEDARIEPRRVLSLEEAIDQMSASDE